jgi:hypothetical protein
MSLFTFLVPALVTITSDEKLVDIFLSNQGTSFFSVPTAYACTYFLYRITCDRLFIVVRIEEIPAVSSTQPGRPGGDVPFRDWYATAIQINSIQFVKTLCPVCSIPGKLVFNASQGPTNTASRPASLPLTSLCPSPPSS